MTTRRWTISTDVSGPTRDIELLLYDEPEHLRSAAASWSLMPGQYNNAHGAVHGFRGSHVGGDGTKRVKPLCAIMRLCRGHLGPEQISHEVAHLAQHLYGLDMLDTYGFLAADHFHPDNDDFAYLFGELFNAVMKILKDEK